MPVYKCSDQSDVIEERQLLWTLITHAVSYYYY